MTNKYDALDWQSFSQKKDIEEIKKNTKDKKDIEITATIEIAMNVSSIIVDKLFADNVPVLLWILILVVSIIPLLWLGYKYIRRLYNKYRTGHDIPETSLMINLFDNDICYYALMAESYSDKINNTYKSSFSDVEQFYFIEACFYINKAIYNLSLTSNCIDKLYSKNSQELYDNKNISYTRLKNIFNILDSCIKKVDNNFKYIKDIDIENNYFDLCNKNKEAYERFKRLFDE